MSATCRVIINQVKQKLHLVGYLPIQHRFKFCSVVAACVSDCGLCTECCAACTLHGTQVNLLVKRNFDLIKMHSTTIKIIELLLVNLKLSL